MRTVINGLTGWARMQQSDADSIQIVDAAITVVGTMLVALAWAIVRR